MQRTLVHGAFTVVLFLAGGCSSGNFMVYKDARSFYITSDRPELKQILCNSGDMDNIVRDSELPATLQLDLKDCVCAPNKDKERLMATLDGMTKEQRAALKAAFRKNGYEINKIADG